MKSSSRGELKANPGCCACTIAAGEVDGRRQWEELQGEVTVTIYIYIKE